MFKLREHQIRIIIFSLYTDFKMVCAGMDKTKQQPALERTIKVFRDSSKKLWKLCRIRAVLHFQSLPWIGKNGIFAKS